MRRLGAVLFLLLLLALSPGLWAWRVYESPGPLAAVRTAVVPHGIGLDGVARTLAADGIIAHPRVFALAVFLSGKAGAPPHVLPLGWRRLSTWDQARVERGRVQVVRSNAISHPESELRSCTT